VKTNIFFSLLCSAAFFLGCSNNENIQEAKRYDDLILEIDREYEVYFNGDIHKAKKAVENVGSMLIKCEEIDSGSRSELILFGKIIQRLRMSRVLRVLDQKELSDDYFEQALHLSSNHSGFKHLNEPERKIEITRLIEGIDALYSEEGIITPRFLSDQPKVQKRVMPLCL